MTSSESLKIKQISAQDTYSVRHPVLRSGKPIDTCVFYGDELPNTFHLGLFQNKKLIGVATFMQNQNTYFDNHSQYQLRGMAVLQKFQGNEFGKLLLEYGKDILKQKNVELIWCNARIKALNFYLRNGYKIIGTPFNIPEIGEHYTMYLKLD